MRHLSFAVAFLPLFVVACSATEATVAGESPDGIEESKSSLARDTAPQVSPAARTALVDANTTFALELFKRSATPAKNLVQSPHSISTALAMVFAGSAGQTKADIADALRFELLDTELHPAFNWLDLQIESRAKDAAGKDGKPARVHVDNLLFGALDSRFGAPFLDTLATSYGAGVQRVDFAEPKTVETINSWVAERTEQRIPKLLDGVSPNTKLVLVNTVYVNAAWSVPFSKNATQDGSFAAPTGARTTPFMSGTTFRSYAENDAAQLVELDLSTAGLVLDVILPTGDLAAFEAAQTAESLAALLSAMSSTNVALTLPKFKIQPSDNGSIRTQLVDLGMGSAFTAAADFTPMVENDRVQLFDVVHKTFFEIDEDGLEAVAATGGIGGSRSAPPETKEVRVDRPFQIVLRDRPTGQVLFLGHIVDPTED